MKSVMTTAVAGLVLALGWPADAQPRGKGKGAAAAKIHVDHRGFADINRNGIPDHRERWIDRNRNGVDDRVEARWVHGSNWCPLGLAMKANGCLPPGQARRLFREGQRVPAGYRYYTPYGTIPVTLRDRYALDDDYRYIYRNNVIYVVDPRTQLVHRIIDLLL
ncbi:MAG TPA: hypothetical protein VM346_02325 [Sphingomicrobium sp.]|jgi:hypothetical protein|nr:hypothetical protein [Sphingomicrobium sp.]HXH52450.1 hypothetical protein [Sphingomicrobium sp.]